MTDLKDWHGKRSRDMSVKKSEIAILAPIGTFKDLMRRQDTSSKSQKRGATTLFHGTSGRFIFNATLVMATEKDGTKFTECILLEITENQSSLNLRNVDGESIKLLIGKL